MNWRRRILEIVDVVGMAGVRLFFWVTRLGRVSTVKHSLWTGTPVINMAINARAERLLGIESKSLVDHAYFITNEFDHNLSRLMKFKPLALVLPYLVLVWAAVRFQRFHFYCDRGILRSNSPLTFHPQELQLLQGLGKEIFFWTYGADVRTQQRTRALGEFHCCFDCPNPGEGCTCDDDRGNQNYARISAAATAVFAMGDMLEYTPGSRNDIFFWPVDLDRDAGRRYTPCYPDPDSNRPIRIVHAPNHRHFKGTRYLLAAVENLKREGFEIDLQLVERVPNREALEIYRSADIIFDQCLIGFHGYFANEAMAMGKPVMTYIRRPEHYLLAPDECPLINADASRVESTLRSLLNDRHRLHTLGVAGRKYIEKYHTLDAFAGRLRLAYSQIGGQSNGQSNSERIAA